MTPAARGESVEHFLVSEGGRVRHFRQIEPAIAASDLLMKLYERVAASWLCIAAASAIGSSTFF